MYVGHQRFVASVQFLLRQSFFGTVSYIIAMVEYRSNVLFGMQFRGRTVFGIRPRLRIQIFAESTPIDFIRRPDVRRRFYVTVVSLVRNQRCVNSEIILGLLVVIISCRETV